MNRHRKDPIVMDTPLIGREIFFNQPSDMRFINDLTPNKKYTVLSIDTQIVEIEDDSGYHIHTSLNYLSAHLNNQVLWKLAKRKNSKQQSVYTKAGRRLG